jgi:peptidoglycan/xylan/chitin deacetylase (PgdA/CDA1 family)
MKKSFWILLAVILLLAVGCAKVEEPTQTLSACQLLGHSWQPASCEAGEVCRVCGQTQGQALGHNWQAPTCDKPETCAVCGKTREEAVGHAWQPADCETPKTCGRCGVTEGESLGHTWQDATCDTPKSCGNCGLTEGEPAGHAWREATCTQPQTCENCGVTEGEVLAHSWRSATCMAPKTCTGCGLTEGSAVDHKWQGSTCSQPTTCVYCGKTDGEAQGHAWQSATCTQPKKCAKCGATSGSAQGHDFEDSTDGKTKLCRTCGELVTIKYVAITFDDGPSGNITKSLLEGLAARNAKATFFICGYRIRSFRSYPQLILDYGHEIGLHTDNHAYLHQLDEAGIRQELAGMLPLLPEGYQVRLMRPPGGYYDAEVKAVCMDMGLSIIMWSTDPRDWETNNVDTIVNRIVNGASHGGIILMHDLKSSSVTAALKAIDILQAQGYVFVTVSELAEIMGKTLEPGCVYYSVK